MLSCQLAKASWQGEICARMYQSYLNEYASSYNPFYYFINESRAKDYRKTLELMHFSEKIVQEEFVPLGISPSRSNIEDFDLDAFKRADSFGPMVESAGFKAIVDKQGIQAGEYSLLVKSIIMEYKFGHFFCGRNTFEPKKIKNVMSYGFLEKRIQ